jgi:8-amino-7-oxononanoate synthase
LERIVYTGAIVMPEFDDRLRAGLAKRHEANLYRQRLTVDSAQGPVIRSDGREYLNFCSNDYLGLAAHPKLIESFRNAALKYGVGSGASHLVCGHSKAHHELEEALADFTGRPRALLFSSGYMANVGTLTALLKAGDNVFQDKLNHASLLDGGLTSPARFRRFPHKNTENLSGKLKQANGASLVAVDGVFSMDGDTAPLAELAQTCAIHDAWLMVDDAHGFGVAGETGAGSVEAAGLSVQDVPILMATLGKALGTAGAFVAGSELLIESLIQHARNYIYTTAMPPAIAVATLTALTLLKEEGWRRQHLEQLIDRFRRGATQMGIPLMSSNGPIQPLQVGDAADALALSSSLEQCGLLVSAIRPPTVPLDTSRLRITITAGHSESQIDQLIEQLSQCWQAR